ncbi:hypothetical protein N7461_004771 [Penicillium sp. DV-2018c]|nr:hypothetical protein N7461_004771 [Penicillium sp. DV-2018c]
MDMFRGTRFWLSMTVPQRLRLKELIKQYGGSVVLTEREADVKLVDPKRKDLPRDTFSYQYVDDSIRNGRLEDIEKYGAGPSGPRPMGATNIAPKSTRSFFTLEEDQILHDWVAHIKKEPGAPVQGNAIYQELAELSAVSQSSMAILAHPLSYEEILQRAPSKGDRPKTLPTRTSSTNLVAKPSSSRMPQAASPAPAQTAAANNTERVQASVPELSEQQQPSISPLKRKAVDAPAAAGPSPRRPRHESPEFQPESPHMTAVPTAVTHSENPPVPERPSPPKSGSSHIISGPPGPLAGLGIPEIFPTSDPTAQTPRRVSHESPPHPADVTEQAEIFPTSNPPAHTPRRISHEAPPHPANVKEQAARPASSRPKGDNAFAQSGRFKKKEKQEPKPKPLVKDVFQDPVDPIFLELPFLPPSPVQEVTDIESWIDQRVARGAKEYHVLTALHCASMDPERADKVLQYLTAGKGIPNDMPGVWTAEDDECVQAMEHSKVQRVLTKHGTQAYQERWDFLNLAEGTGLIE